VNFLILFPLLPLIAYWQLVLNSAVNIPLWDDYDSVLNITNLWLNAPLAEKFRLIFSQHNEHRIALLRIFSIIQYYLSGAINFRWQVIIANLLLTIFYLLFWYGIRSTLKDRFFSSIFMTALGFVIFQPQYADAMIWATTSLSIFGVLLFAFLSFILVFQRKLLCQFFAAISALVGLFSFASGAIIPLCILFGLFVLKERRLLIAWSLWTAILFGLFLWGYHQPPHHPSIFDTNLDLNQFFDYLLILVGSIWGGSEPEPSRLAGIIILSLAVISFMRGSFKKAFPYALLFFFAFGSALLTAIARSPAGITYALSPGRYTLFSALLTISTLTLLFSTIYNKRIKNIFLLTIVPVSIFFNVISYRTYTIKVTELSRQLLRQYAQWVIGEPGLTYPWPDSSDRTLQASLKAGTFSLETIEFGKWLAPNTLELPVIQDDQLTTKVPRLSIGNGYIFIEGKVATQNKDIDLSNLEILLSDQTSIFRIRPRTYTIPTFLAPSAPNSKNQMGFITLLPLNKISLARQYKVGVQIRQDHALKRHWIKKKIN